MKSAESIYSEYDSFAWFYDKYWGEEFSLPALAIFNLLLFPRLPARARILDLCCGTGQLAAGLCARGFRVTGVDGSAAMLEFARAHAPKAEFIHADARAFEAPARFDAVISAFDSLNHVMELDALTQVFANVRASLTDGGVLLFDLNMDDAGELAEQTLEMVEDDHVCVVRGSYTPAARLKKYAVTMFRLLDGRWQRRDLTLWQRYYSETEVLGALAAAGFAHVRTYDARREFGLTISDGRMFFLARMTNDAPAQPPKRKRRK